MPGETEGLPKTPLFSIRYCLPRAGVDRSDSIDSVRNRDLALVFHLVVLFTAAVFRAEVRVEVSGIGIGFDFAFCVWLWLTCPPRPSLAFIIAWGARVPGSGTGQFPVWAIRPGTPPNKQFETQQRENAEPSSRFPYDPGTLLYIPSKSTHAPGSPSGTSRIAALARAASSRGRTPLKYHA